MIRVSVTDLEQYRYYCDSEDMELETLLSRLRRSEEKSPEMLRGIAFHEVLENLGPCEIDVIEHGGFRFRFDMEGELSLPKIRELKAEKEYQVNGETVVLVGKVDAMKGFEVHDHKLTKTIDAENYTDSLQWRCYLDMFGAKKFIYNVFQGYEDRTGDIVIKDFQTFPFFDYPEMKRDISTALNGFIKFAKTHLPERFCEQTI